MSFTEYKSEIEAILNRDVADECGQYNIDKLPKGIIAEANVLAAHNSLFPLLFIKFITGAELRLIKELAGKMKWVTGDIY